MRLVFAPQLFEVAMNLSFSTTPYSALSIVCPKKEKKKKLNRKRTGETSTPQYDDITPNHAQQKH